MIEPTHDPEGCPSGTSVPSGSHVGAGLDERARFSIDPLKGTLESANSPARRLLSIPATAALPIALDGAMPAIRRIRQIAAGAAASEIERLIFWRAGRVLPIEASVTRAHDAAGSLVTVVAHAPPDVAPANGESHEPAPSPTPTPPPQAVREPEQPQVQTADSAGPAPPQARTDQETLREIARRIREGGREDGRENGREGEREGRMGEARTGDADRASFSTATDGAASSEEPASDRESAARTAASPTPVPLRPVATRFKLQANDPRQLSKLAHELRTPLSAIMAAAEVMRDEQLGPMGNERYLGYAGDIRDSARHALDVVNAMLSGAPRDQLEGETIDLNDIAETVVSAMHPVAEGSGITLEADCDAGRLPVHGDATAIRQILFNLISNALKFTPQGGDVRVATGYLADGTPYLVVRDTGDGMTETEITRAFYATGTRGGPRKGGGYGMGLPIVRSLAEAMGAAIEVDSAPGRGTVVLVAFANP